MSPIELIKGLNCKGLKQYGQLGLTVYGNHVSGELTIKLIA